MKENEERLEKNERETPEFAKKEKKNKFEAQDPQKCKNVQMSDASKSTILCHLEVCTAVHAVGNPVLGWAQQHADNTTWNRRVSALDGVLVVDSNDIEHPCFV